MSSASAATRLEREEIASLEAYGPVRDAYRRAVIEHKRSRRLGVGPNVTLVFEDHETLRFQVQEMVWVERIHEPEHVQHEIDVYNELMPGPGELSATLFVEITEPGKIRAELDRLVGIDEHVALVLGGDERVPARFDEKQFEEERISAVQYIRFRLSDAQCDALSDPSVPAALAIDHPHYRHETPLPPELRGSLARGLREAPSPLLPELPEVAGDAREVLFEDDTLCVYRPDRPEAPGHLIVEARVDTGVGGGELDEALWNALGAELLRVAQGALANRGGCRILADVRPGAPLRWHVFPRPE